MRCNFVVGQKVECINDAGWMDARGVTGPLITGPSVGDVCKVMELYAEGDRVFIALFEYDRPNPGFIGPPLYESDFFRPLQERKTDISIFQALLNPVKQREDA